MPQCSLAICIFCFSSSRSYLSTGPLSEVGCGGSKGFLWPFGAAWIQGYELTQLRVMHYSHEHSELALIRGSATCSSCIYIYLKVLGWALCVPLTLLSLCLAASFLLGISHYLCLSSHHFYSGFSSVNDCLLLHFQRSCRCYIEIAHGLPVMCNIFILHCQLL